MFNDHFPGKATGGASTAGCETAFFGQVHFRGFWHNKYLEVQGLHGFAVSSAPAGARSFRADYRGRREACPRLISKAPPGQGKGEGRNLSHTRPGHIAAPGKTIGTTFHARSVA